ncbi:PAS domain S-box protein [Falsirhodobacter sp. 1013]|uniref:PAS domain S-box protein n=1 Tax=Falsirhodobacter sp. 1013 TaxID=3417566 RepID=UPI003EBC1F5E
MTGDTGLLAQLPVPVYTTDTAGNITFYNEAAARFWGYRPTPESRHWCGSWTLLSTEGKPLSREMSALAATLREGRPVQGMEMISEGPDGARRPFVAFPNLLRDEAGQVVGGINLLMDASQTDGADLRNERLAAIVSSSDDIIISKTLGGHITSWNAAATRLLGYEAEEMIGQSITKIIPPELLHEEEKIIRMIRSGERVDHFDTERLRKDGTRIHLSLTVSPLRDRDGRIAGASKVARDVSGRKKAEDMQQLLIHELNHRVKNMLAVIQAIATQSLRRAPDPDTFVRAFRGRLQALARAHDVVVRGEMKGADLFSLLREQVLLGNAEDQRVNLSGPSVFIASNIIVPLALVLHELATNARKYGALSRPEARLRIEWSLTEGAERRLHLEWRESGVPGLGTASAPGFGTQLISSALDGEGGTVETDYRPDGITCRIDLPASDGISPAPTDTVKPGKPEQPGDAATSTLAGARILIIEDEPIVAMDVADQVRGLEAGVIGPAATLEQALHLAEQATFDAALVDANLNGLRTDDLAQILTRRGIPFAFATGYGREALPVGFEATPVLAKPFSRDDLGAVLRSLLRSRVPG